MNYPKILTPWPIRKKLLLLLLVIFLPALASIIFSGLNQRREAILKAQNSASLLAQSLAAQEEQIANSTKTMLSILAQLRRVQSLDAPACNELFREMRRRYPFYSFIGAVTPDGNLFAASEPYQPGVNLSDRKHIQDAIRTLDFSVGEYIIGRVSKVNSLNFTFPVLDAQKRLVAILIAGFRLNEFGRFISEANLPEGSAVVFLDYKGLRLHRLPENEATPLGQAPPQSFLELISGHNEEGLFQWKAMDGIDRIWAYKRLRLKKDSFPYLYIAVGQPKDPIIHQANMDMLANLSILGFAALLAMSLAWVFGNLVLVKPVNQLVTATQRFGRGKMDTRTGLPHTPDELGRLARSFDDMAALLERRSSEREKAEAALSQAYADLEGRVQERTAELATSNAALRVSQHFLEIVHQYTEINPLLNAFVAEIKGYTGCEAVGIRLLDAAGGIPYLAYEGFSQRFYETESPLSIKTDHCMCINVITGVCNPKLSFYTPAGSFYMNGTTRFLATVSEADKGRTRNVCNLEGYESVSLIPIRRGDRILGLIHVADRREAVVPLEMVEILEKAALQLGTAIERVQAQEALRDNEQFLTDIFNGIQDGLSIMDPDLNLLRVNQAMEAFGYLQPMVGRKCYEVYHGASAPCKVCPAQQTLLTGKASREIVTEYQADGSDRFFEINAFPLLNRTSGRVQAVIEYARDITEPRRAEQALAEEAIRRRLLFEQSRDGIVVVDENGKVYEANQQYADMLGYSLEEVQQLHIWDWDAKFNHEQIEEIVRSVNQAGQIFETLHRRKDGTVYDVEISANAVTLAGQKLGFCVCRDISQRKKTEEERLRFSKLESLATLAGGIAHDFNNILTAILGNINLAGMANSNLPQEGRQELLVEAEKACQQAQALARQLLTFAKGGAPVKKLVALEQLITESASFTCRGSQVRSDFVFADNLWTAEVDPGQINQVFQNLVINAVQAMPTGGTITVRGENLEAQSGSELPLEPGRYVKIRLQDQGVGMPAEYLAKIFDPYFTTKQKGSGLGLATAYSIVRNHHGHIGVESKLGVGTVFQVYLPASDRKLTPLPAEDQGLLAGKGKVLVMDDEELVRLVLDKMLGLLGYEAEFAKDGDEAIALFIQAQRSGVAFDAVILDLTIPGGLGGQEVLEQLLKIDSLVKAIVSSGYSEDPIMAEFEKYGFHGILAKPFKVPELGKVLHKVILEKT